MTSVEPTPDLPAPGTPPTSTSASPVPPSPTPTTAAPSSSTPATTTPEASHTPDPSRPDDPAQAALFDAIANENAVIFGYGIVSAHSSPEVNALVAEALLTHRTRREEALALAAGQDSPAPLPAVGYQLPMAVDTPTDAAELAVRMEQDSAAAWRAVLEQATAEQTRRLAVPALTDSAVLAARWRARLDRTPVTVAFPAGNE